MEVQLRNTTKVVHIIVDGVGIPARLWEGHTASGIPVHAYITRIAVHPEHDLAQFDRELMEQQPPTPAIAAIPARLIL